MLKEAQSPLYGQYVAWSMRVRKLMSASFLGT
jgi:hypothetical protein